MNSTPQMILSNTEPFAIGGRRECFIVPGDDSRCVKVYGVNGWPLERRQKAVWYKRMRPLYFFDDNKREFNAYKELARHGDEVWNFFPKCYGLVETDRGLGIVTDLIRNDDGKIASSLEGYIQQHGKNTAIEQALNDFYEFILREAVITRDILIHNVIVQQSAERLNLFMVDGFGSTEVIPFSSWCKTLGRKKVRRKIERFKARYSL